MFFFANKKNTPRSHEHFSNSTHLHINIAFKMFDNQKTKH
jgi:hypothetical protein